MREMKFFATKSVVIKSSYFEFDQLMDVKLRRHQKSLSWVFVDFAEKKKRKKKGKLGNKSSQVSISNYFSHTIIIMISSVFEGSRDKTTRFCLSLPQHPLVIVKQRKLDAVMILFERP